MASRVHAEFISLDSESEAAQEVRPEAHVVLRDKIRNLHRKVDGLLTRTTARTLTLGKNEALGDRKDIAGKEIEGETEDALVGKMKGGENAGEQLVEALERAEIGARENGAKEAPAVLESDAAVLENSCTSASVVLENASAVLGMSVPCVGSLQSEKESFESEEEEIGDSEYEEMAEIFVKSLRKHQRNAEMELSTLAAKNVKLKELTASEVSSLEWRPNTELAPATSKKQSLINSSQKLDSDLVDGLLVPPRDPRKQNKLARKKIPDTTGSKWFNMPAKTLTPELKRDLQLLNMRNVLDPKHHYKREKKSKELPKYFQIGTVIAGPAEFYSSRLTRKQQKTSFAEELLADSSVNDYRKRKYNEIMQQNKAGRSKKRKAKK